MAEKDNNKFLNVIAGLFLAGFSVFAVMELRTILIPFVIALIISFIFEPFFKWMRSKRIPQSLAITIILITILVIANLASLFIVASIETFTSNFSVYEEKLLAIINSIVISLELSQEEIQKINEYLKLQNLLEQGTLSGLISEFLKGFLTLFGDILLVLIYVIFILSDLVSFKERVRIAFKDDRAESILKTIERIFEDVRSYITGKTILSLILGIISGFIMWIFGVDFYFIWGFLIFITHYIPNIGAFFGLSIPIIMMFIQFDNIVTPIVVAVLLIVTDNILGNIIEPIFLGDRLNLSPILLLISLFMGEYLWGIVGMVLSVPIVSMLKIVLMNFESTKPVAILMSYKPAYIGSRVFKFKKDSID